jgi:hypothetical protein
VFRVPYSVFRVGRASAGEGEQVGLRPSENLFDGPAVRSGGGNAIVQDGGYVNCLAEVATDVFAEPLRIITHLTQLTR